MMKTLSALMVVVIAAMHLPAAAATEFYVAPDGNDENPGTIEKPLATLSAAQRAVRGAKGTADGPITVYLGGGICRLKETIVFTAEDSGAAEAPITYTAAPGQRVLLTGGVKVISPWAPYKNGIYRCGLAGTPLEDRRFTQLFVNGRRQHRARFPNYDPADPLRTGSGYRMVTGGSGHRPDTFLTFDPATFTRKRWANPQAGVVHAFQSHNWGNVQHRIESVDWAANRINLGEGGWQLQRTHGIGSGRGSSSPFYVENIFEELDSPGEWFLDTEQNTLYYQPHEGVNLRTAVVEAAVLDRLFEFRGAAAEPVHHVTLSGFTVSQTGTTFLDEYEDLARGDWAIHRGGAVFLEGAEDCSVRDCLFDQLGSNGVFLSGYNRRVSVTGCKFEAAGESGVCFVGRPTAVRMYQTWADPDSWIQDMENHDLEPGPKTPAYPADCTVDNSIFHNIGIYGKQTAGVFISMSSRVTVSHNTIYDVPRAAICINDGTWGGHVIEHNDIWETVRETGEHGPFNAWGRERFWNGLKKDLVLLDAVEPVIIRNNRVANFRKSISAGNWTIDLDDGSSNYQIYNNLSLGSTLKLRDGYYRNVFNNIHVSPVELGWHCWPQESEDRFTRNIVVVCGAKPGATGPTADLLSPRGSMCDHPWGREMDHNLYWNVNTRRFQLAGDDFQQWQARGYDANSVFADPMFVDPAGGDYSVKPDSAALELGFKNFPMDRFGHRQTRIVPFGGEFVESIEVQIKPDARGGEVRYTLDGSRPTPRSTKYDRPLVLRRAAVLRACTFKDGLRQGFVESATFKKVDKLSRPSWLETLLAGEWSGDVETPTAGKPQAAAWLGATLDDITEGDQIDALGGIGQGVLLKDVPTGSTAYKLGFRSSDVIDTYDGRKTPDTKALMAELNEPGDGEATVEVLRDYQRVKIAVPKIIELPAGGAKIHGRGAGRRAGR